MQIDFQSPEFCSNPYPTYTTLRQHSPIFFYEDWNMWFVSSHDDCKALLRDERLGVWRPKEVEGQETLYKLLSLMFVFIDPPDHTRLRRLVLKAFTPRTVELQRDKIELLTARLLDSAIDISSDLGSVDLRKTFLQPLPAIVIAEMLGVPAEDYPLFLQWSEILTLGLDLSGDPEAYAKAPAAAEAFMAYVADLADERRRNPADDLLSALVHVQEEGIGLTLDELHATCAGLLVGGQETTVHLIGNAVIALLNNPEEASRLRANPQLSDSAIDEFLRFDAPLQMTSRLALKDIEYKGHTFKKGQDIYLILGAGNRDPAQFEQPERLDIERTPNQHLAFGGGIHYCLGAPLAKLEASIAIRQLLERAPDLALATDSLEYRVGLMFRGVTELPVTFNL